MFQHEIETLHVIIVILSCILYDFRFSVEGFIILENGIGWGLGPGLSRYPRVVWMLGRAWWRCRVAAVKSN